MKNHSCSIPHGKLQAKAKTVSKKRLLLIRGRKEFVTNVKKITISNTV